MWRAIGQTSLFEKRRKRISRNSLLTEIELAQPMLSVSSLLCELEQMNILPNICNVWAIDSFRNASTLCHLDLANMIQNLFLMASVISSGELPHMRACKIFLSAGKCMSGVRHQIISLVTYFIIEILL